MEEKAQARGECKGDEGVQKLLLHCGERHSRPFHKSFMISKSQCMRADVMSHDYPFILFFTEQTHFYSVFTQYATQDSFINHIPSICSTLLSSDLSAYLHTVPKYRIYFLFLSIKLTIIKGDVLALSVTPRTSRLSEDGQKLRLRSTPLALFSNFVFALRLRMTIYYIFPEILK